MIASVWKNGIYDYYEAIPSTRSLMSSEWLTPEQASWKAKLLRYIGKGTIAKGMIVSTGYSGTSDFQSSTPTWLLIAIVGYLAAQKYL